MDERKWEEGELADRVTKTGERTQVYIDHLMDDGRIRVIRVDDGEFEWVTSGDLQALDVVTKIATLESKTYEEQIEEIEAEEKAND